MFSEILDFRKKTAPAGWRVDELAECYRVVGLLARSGLPVSIDSGLTDEGEPWAIVLRDDTGDVLLHMARIDGTFVVVSAAGSASQRGESLRAVVDSALQSGGLGLLSRQSDTSNIDILRLHPSTLIAAFITTAWLHTQAHQSAPFDAPSGRDDALSSERLGDARPSGGTGAGTPSPVGALATAAASFAAVAAALNARHADPLLEVTPSAFVEAVLAFAPEQQEKNLAAPPPFELDSLEPGIRPGDALSAQQITLTAQEPPAGNTTTAVTPDPRTETSGTLDRLLTAEPHATALALDLATASPGASPPPARADAHAPQWLEADFSPADDGAPRPPQHLLGSNERPATPVQPVVHELLTGPGRPIQDIGGSARALAAHDVSPPMRGGDDVQLSKISLSPTPPEGGTGRISSPTDALSLIFKDAARILHLDREGLILTAGAPIGPGRQSLAQDDSASADPSRPQNISSDGTQVRNSIKLTASEAVAPATTVADLSSPAGSSKDATFITPVSGGAAAKTQATQAPLEAAPKPSSNAQTLLNFTAATEHAVQVSRSDLLSQIRMPVELASDTQKVIVFDAAWLDIKSFMLMPGVLMVEDDALGGVNRAGLDMKAQPVSLDIAPGLKITLLGVLDVSQLPSA